MTIKQLIVGLALGPTTVGLALHRIEPRPVVAPAAVKTLVRPAAPSRRHLASLPRRRHHRGARSSDGVLSSRRLY